MSEFKIAEKVAVLCGGDGRERDVSLNSGSAVCAALQEAGFQAEVLDLHSLDEIERKIKGYSKAFIAMHGDWGEDGELQARLESMGVPYTGSGPEASALAMDKWRARELLSQAGIKTPKGILLSQDREAKFNFTDVVVKPRSGGSTVGVSILKKATPKSLDEAVKLARESYAGDVLIEEYIEGRELTVAVWEHDGLADALPVIEIVPKTGFYDYKNKYTSGATEYIVPARIEPDIAQKAGEAAVKAHKILGCRAYSRADFRMSLDGTVYILEVNTAPGMTATSLVPKAARAAGINMSEFVKHILLMAR